MLVVLLVTNPILGYINPSCLGPTWIQMGYDIKKQWETIDPLDVWVGPRISSDQYPVWSRSVLEVEDSMAYHLTDDHRNQGDVTAVFSHQDL